jgi:hypothetical protein
MWHPFIGRGSSEMIGEGAFNGWRQVELQNDHLDPGRGALSQGNDGVCAHFGRGGGGGRQAVPRQVAAVVRYGPVGGGGK